MREMESFVKDYSINQYGKDYNVKLDLTYKYRIKNGLDAVTILSFDEFVKK